MARPLRIQFPGAFYHVMSRGNEKQDIYRTCRDREKFLSYLHSASERYGAVIHCYCLMDNHYHLMVETPGGNLSQIMRHINGAYSSYFNVRHKRVGHLYQGRYQSNLVEVDTYCLTLSRYIHLNPMRGGMVVSPSAYEWSSCRFYLDNHPVPEWLRIDLVLSLFGERQNSRGLYQKYLEDQGAEENELQGEMLATNAVLGGDQFLEDVREKYLDEACDNRDLPAAKSLKNETNIHHIVDAVTDQLRSDRRLAKKMSIYICHHFSGRSLKEIGAYFGVGESAVTLNSQRFAAILYQDQRLAETVAGLLAELKM